MLSEPAFSATPSCEIVDYGILAQAKVLEAREAPGAATGKELIIDATRIYERTERIPARLGLRFGVRHVFRNIPADDLLEVIVTHPPMVQPSGEAITVSRVRKDPISTGTSYGFDLPSELLPGQWLFEFKYRGKLLCQQAFIVVVAQ